MHMLKPPSLILTVWQQMKARRDDSVFSDSPTINGCELAFKYVQEIAATETSWQSR